MEDICTLEGVKYKSILVVKVDNIGDFLIWLNTAYIYGEVFKGYAIDLIVDKKNYDIAEKVNIFNEITAIDSRKFYVNLIYRIDIILSLKKLRYKCVINPTYSRIDFVDNSIVRHVLSPRKIGMQNNRASLNCSLNEMHEIHKLNEYDRYWEFYTLFGGSILKSEKIINLINTKNSRRLINSKYVIINLGASWAGRILNPKKYIESIEMLHFKYGFQVVFGGSSNEKKYLDIIKPSLSCDIVDMIGKTNYVEYIDLIINSDFVLTTETSVAHVCVAYDHKSLVILGGGHFKRFLPVQFAKNIHYLYFPMDCYGCNWACKYEKSITGEVKCIESIGSVELKEAIIDILEKRIVQ